MCVHEYLFVYVCGRVPMCVYICKHACIELYYYGRIPYLSLHVELVGSFGKINDLLINANRNLIKISDLCSVCVTYS